MDENKETTAIIEAPVEPVSIVQPVEPTSIEPLIKVENLNVVYNLGKSNEVRALTGVNLEIYPEEFIIFFGPSGCGKSTLLYAISGLETNIQGKVNIHGKNMLEFSTQEYLNFHRKTIGMIFQAFYLIPSLTVVRNVTLPQVFLNTGKVERRNKAMDLLEYFGVKAQAYKLPTELSGGQQQRIAISRSLVNDPEVIMADEPVGNLDSKSSEDVMKILQKLNEEKKKTVILVTHDPSFLSIAHRVFYLKDGHVVDVKVNKTIKALEFQKPPKIERDISRELDLLINTFSSLTPDQIGNLLIPFKAKQIVSEALIGLTSEDLRKIEQKVETMLMTGVYQDDSTYELLDTETEKGGLGLDKRTALKLADKVKDMVREIKLLEEEDKRIKDHVSPDNSSEIMQVRHYLLEVFETHLKTFAALEVFDKAIGERLSTAIDRKEFVTRLYTPLSKGGCGIHKRTSKKIGKRFELLILGKYK